MGQQLRYLTTLAELSRDIIDKRVFTLEFRDVLANLERAGVVVTGESSMLQDLERRLVEAHNILRTMAEGVQRLADAEILLADLRRRLTGPEWTLARQFHQRLEQVAIGEEERIRKYREESDSLQRKTDELADLLTEAGRARAPVSAEKLRRQEVVDRLKAASRALNAANYSQLPALGAEVAEIDGLVQQVRDKTEATRPFARQADLLLLRSARFVPVGASAVPASNGSQPAIDGTNIRTDAQQWWLYTVLLRTPNDSGGQGISIQRSSTVVPQDRQLMSDLVNRITKAVGEGVVRRGVTSNAVTPGNTNANIVATQIPIPDPASVNRLAVEDPVQRDAMRRFLFVNDDQGTTTLPFDASALIRHVGDHMYRLLVPEQMQDYLQDDRTRCSLTITTNDLELPWELMYVNNEFLCLDRPLGRLPMGRAFPRTPRPRTPDKTRFLLIYADPTGNLRAARREVDTIADALLDHWKARVEVDRLNLAEATGRKLNEALSAGRYDVIHYAGHAYFNPEAPEMSGLLLHDKEVFVSQKVQRLLEGRPLVFLNACETACVANESDPQQVDYVLDHAAGLASDFLYGGAIGCVGSLWPIYDEPAAQFAITFYNKVLEGNMIGQATLEARKEIRSRFPDSVTWAAFVLYGNPTAVL